KPCSEMFCLRNQDITDAKAFFIYFLCRTQVKIIKRGDDGFFIFSGFCRNCLLYDKDPSATQTKNVRAATRHTD
ncbi:hypothetical protein, partial [Acinetobacter gandensis]|uniref:hypothetical protein n=1 Tax=Acinetobacter gandensis TaxID=1443941 RepID=UPI003F54C902